MSIVLVMILIVVPIVNPYYRRPTYRQYDETLWDVIDAVRAACGVQYL